MLPYRTPLSMHIPPILLLSCLGPLLMLMPSCAVSLTAVRRAAWTCGCSEDLQEMMVSQPHACVRHACMCTHGFQFACSTPAPASGSGLRTLALNSNPQLGFLHQASCILPAAPLVAGVHKQA
jgi:hypothetical protein